MLDLQDQAYQGHHHLNCQVESVLVSQVVQIVVLCVLNPRELVDVVDD